MPYFKATFTFWDGPHSVCGVSEFFQWWDIKNLSFIKSLNQVCDLRWKMVLTEFESLSSGFKFPIWGEQCQLMTTKGLDKVRKGVELGLSP